MEKSTAERIKSLRSHYNLSVKEFSVKCGLSHVAIFHLENGKTIKPHKSSLLRIASSFGTTVEWILYGRNEMLPNGSKALDGDIVEDEFWKNEAYLELKSKNQILEKEVERLWQIVNHLSGNVNSRLDRVWETGS